MEPETTKLEVLSPRDSDSIRELEDGVSYLQKLY